MRFPVLDSLDGDTRSRLIRAGQQRRFRRNEVVFHEGDSANALHLLITGHVSVRVTTPMGYPAILAVLGPGATFGELALLSDNRLRAATVTALDPVETFMLTRDQFTTLRQELPSVERFLIDLLAAYIGQLNERLVEALYVPVEKRVLRHIVTLSHLYGDGSPGTIIPLTQGTLAGLAGTTRSTTNQVLRRAEAAGLISLVRGRVKIEVPEPLARRAALAVVPINAPDGMGDRGFGAGEECPRSACSHTSDPRLADLGNRTGASPRGQPSCRKCGARPHRLLLLP